MGVRRQILRIVILLLAVVLVAAGSAWGEPSAIRQKAAVVCLECIGIG